MKNKFFIAFIAGILLFQLSSAVLISDQGTDVISKSTGQLLATGNLTITIYDNTTSGNLIFNQTFSNTIANGSWNLMLSPSLEYGKNYWKDYEINGEDLDFDGNERLEFQSSLGLINNVSFINFSLVQNCASGSSIRLIYENGSVVCETDDSQDINLTSYALKNQSETFQGNATFEGNITTSQTGFFTWLGAITSRITKLWIVDINATGNIETSENISARYFKGDGSLLTNLPAGTESDPKFTAENASLWTEAKSKFNSSYDSTYNSTYALYSYNQTGIFGYNQSINIPKNSTTLSIANITDFLYNYNQTLSVYYYNQTASPYFYNQTGQFNYNQTGIYGYNQSINVPINSTTLTISNITNFLYNYNQSDGSYNSTYALYSYNQTGQFNYNQSINIPSNSTLLSISNITNFIYNYNQSGLYNYNQSTNVPSNSTILTISNITNFIYNYNQTGSFNYNQTASPYFYNQTISVYYYNQTQSPYFYNQSDGNYNSTYNNLLNYKCPAGQVVNGTLSNGTITCITPPAGAESDPLWSSNLTSGVSSDLLPATNIIQSLGSSAKRWLTGWFKNLDVSNNATISQNISAQFYYGSLNQSTFPTSACSGTNKVTQIYANGSVGCASDQTGGGSSTVKSIISGKGSAGVTADALYHPIGEVVAVTTYDEEYGMPIPFASTIHNITLWADAGQGNGDTCTLNVMKATSCSAGASFSSILDCSIIDTAQSCTNTTAIGTINAGDCIYVFFDEAGGTCSLTPSWSFVLES